MRRGDYVSFKFIRKDFNDGGYVYSGTVLDTYVNGFKVEINGQEINVMYADVKVLDAYREVRL